MGHKSYIWKVKDGFQNGLKVTYKKKISVGRLVERKPRGMMRPPPPHWLAKVEANSGVPVPGCLLAGSGLQAACRERARDPRRGVGGPWGALARAVWRLRQGLLGYHLQLWYQTYSSHLFWGRGDVLGNKKWVKPVVIFQKIRKLRS